MEEIDSDEAFNAAMARNQTETTNKNNSVNGKCGEQESQIAKSQKHTKKRGHWSMVNTNNLDKSMFMSEVNKLKSTSVNDSSKLKNENIKNDSTSCTGELIQSSQKEAGVCSSNSSISSCEWSPELKYSQMSNDDDILCYSSDESIEVKKQNTKNKPTISNTKVIEKTDYLGYLNNHASGTDDESNPNYVDDDNGMISDS
eukprot:scaffold36044_cov94-Cyclotella_meneghiniana.AAC.1